MDERPRGIWAASVTPVDETGAVDPVRLVAHLRRLLARGCHGVVLFGTTGEAPSFTVDQRRRALDAVRAAGIPAERLMVGVGCPARDDTLALARHARDHGVRWLLVMPPFFFKRVEDEGVYRAFAEVLDGLDADARLLLYHFPQLSGVPVGFAVIERLLARDPARVVGIKDSSGDLDHTLALIRTFRGLAVFSGNDAHLLDNLRAGGAGAITAGHNLAADWAREVWAAFRDGDEDRAARWMERVRAVRHVLERHPMIPALKAVLADGLGDPAWATVRPPLVALDGTRARSLLEELDAVGYVFEPGDFTAVAD